MQPREIRELETQPLGEFLADEAIREMHDLFDSIPDAPHTIIIPPPLVPYVTLDEQGRFAGYAPEGRAVLRTLCEAVFTENRQR